MRVVTKSQSDSLLTVNDEITQFLTIHSLSDITNQPMHRVRLATLLARQDRIIRQIFAPHTMANESLQKRAVRKSKKDIRDAQMKPGRYED